jgi:hypothetical protein
MGGFKSVESAGRFCRVYDADEVRNFLRPQSQRKEEVALVQRRIFYTAHTYPLDFPGGSIREALKERRSVTSQPVRVHSDKTSETFCLSPS